MKFKLRHVAALATLAMGGAASAHTLVANPGTVTYSRQGAQLSGSTANSPLPGFDVTLGADYSVNDNIDLTIAGATVGGDTNANLAIAANIDCGADIIVSFVARTGNVIALRVTQKNVANTVGVVCTVADGSIEITDPSIASSPGAMTATWAARTAITNISFDPQTAPVGAFTLATVIDQFTSSNSVDFNATVDVNSGRTAFTSGTGPTDTMTFGTLNTHGTAGPNATFTQLVITVTGNFSREGGVGCHGVGTDNGVISMAADCQSLTVTDATLVNGVGESYTLTLTPSGVLVAPQTFSATIRFDYSGVIGPGTETDSYGAGAWNLNGFTAWVGYMPYGPGISQIIYISNESSQTGAVTLNARNQAGVACTPAGSIATVQGNRVTQLSGAIRTALEACYGVGFTDRVQFRLTANIPADDADVYSAYNVNGVDRGTVVNDSNGRVTDLTPVLDALGS